MRPGAPRFLPASLIALRHYSPRTFLADLVAGITVGLVALPLAMAFAIASGLPPESGLYCAVVAGFIVSALGGSMVQVAGPTGAFVVILAGVTAQYGVDGLLLATCMAGVILILLGVASFGGVLRFIPDPVVTVSVKQIGGNRVYVLGKVNRPDRKSTRLNSSHATLSRMPSSA